MSKSDREDCRTWLDRAIYWMAPGYGASRISNRTKFNAFYEGADRDRLRGHHWNTMDLSTDAGLEENLPEIRRRSNQLYRDSGLVHGLVESRVKAIVKDGFRPQARIQAAQIGIDQDQADRIGDQAERLYQQWAPHADVTGHASLDLQLAQVQRCVDVIGDCLIEFADRGNAEKPIPLAVRVIPGTMIETPAELAFDPLVRMGIRYDEVGRRLGYYVRESEPGDNKSFGYKHRYISVRYAKTGALRALHVFEQLFPLQSRGLPLMSSVLNEMKDVKDLSESAIIRERLINCFVGIRRTEGNAQANAERSADGVDNRGNLLEDLEPGTLINASLDDDFEFINPDTPSSQYVPFVDSKKRDIAAGAGWPYSRFSRDYSGMSFSAGKQEQLPEIETVQVARKMLKEQFLVHVWRYVFEEGRFIRNDGSGAPLIEVSETLFRRHTAAFLNHEWGDPGRPLLDPPREWPALIAAVNSGLISRQFVARLVNGQDWMGEVAPQYKRELELLAEMNYSPPGVVGPSDEELDRDERTADGKPAAATNDQRR